ncbi:hypothetical protein ACFFRR_010024 [Megaselia abdita]
MFDSTECDIVDRNCEHSSTNIKETDEAKTKSKSNTDDGDSTNINNKELELNSDSSPTNFGNSGGFDFQDLPVSISCVNCTEISIVLENQQKLEGLIMRLIEDLALIGEDIKRIRRENVATP